MPCLCVSSASYPRLDPAAERGGFYVENEDDGTRADSFYIIRADSPHLLARMANGSRSSTTHHMQRRCTLVSRVWSLVCPCPDAPQCGCVFLAGALHNNCGPTFSCAGIWNRPKMHGKTNRLCEMVPNPTLGRPRGSVPPCRPWPWDGPRHPYVGGALFPTRGASLTQLCSDDLVQVPVQHVGRPARQRAIHGATHRWLGSGQNTGR